MTTFSGICLITENISTLAGFYAAVLRAQAEGDEDFVSFPGTGLAFTLFSRAALESMAPRALEGAGCGGCTLDFEVEDVDQETRRLTGLGVPLVKPPITYPWGRRSAWFRDPDGNLVNLYTKLQPAEPTRPEAVVRAYFERALNQKDDRVFDELLAPDYCDHDAPPGTPPGPEEPRRFVAEFIQAVPDLQVKIEALLAVENQVTARLVWDGHDRAGAAFHQAGLVLLRLNAAGQIAERWSAYEPG